MSRWDRWIDWPAGAEVLDSPDLAPGYSAGTASVGLKGPGSDDLALLRIDSGLEARSALALTANAAAAAPVQVCRESCDSAHLEGVVVTAGNANAGTGDKGLEDARAIRQRAAEALGLEYGRVAIAQTGVIGVPLDLEPLLEGVDKAAEDLGHGHAHQFANAIRTTDAMEKQIAVFCDGVTLTAQAKGAGMIQPGFATMLCFVQTDGVCDGLTEIARSAVGRSFERISVDGQMSTNDTVVVQANGASGLSMPEGLLDAAMLHLALEIVGDGEGATRVARATVTGAADDEEAERVARAIANSPLIKTALYGRDPNWGRILQAVGAELAGEDIGGFGQDSIAADELESDRQEVEISVELSRGEASAHTYFSDLTKRYIEINAEYTT